MFYLDPTKPQSQGKEPQGKRPAFIAPLGEVEAAALGQPSAAYFEVLSQQAKDIGVPVVHFESGLLLVGQQAQNSKLLAIMQTAIAAQIVVSNIRLASSTKVIEIINQHEPAAQAEDTAISDADSIRMFADIMAEAHGLGAQDIYIVLSRENNQAYCQYKVDNDLIEQVKWMGDFNLGLSVCAALFDGRESAGQSVGRFDESTTRQETQFKHSVYDQHGQLAEEYSIRFTKSKTSKISELLVQMRLQPVSYIRRLGDLAVPVEVMTAIKQQMIKSKGIMLTSGPVGSGKNTLLMAILLGYPKRVLIQTFEDPLEIPVPRQYRNIIQNTIDTVLGSKNQLKTIMRQAPNGIYLTEVRDEQTAEFLYYVAKSGHFALTTIHANSAVGVVERLVSLGVSYQDIGADGATNLIMAQRLVKCLCDHCKVPLGELLRTDAASYREKIKLLDSIDLGGDEDWQMFVRHGKGCGECHWSGEQKGRRLVIEIIVLTDEDRAYIRDGNTQQWQQHLIDKGFNSIDRQLIGLLKSGQMDVQRLLENS